MLVHSIEWNVNKDPSRLLRHMADDLTKPGHRHFIRSAEIASATSRMQLIHDETRVVLALFLKPTYLLMQLQLRFCILHDDGFG